MQSEDSQKNKNENKHITIQNKSKKADENSKILEGWTKSAAIKETDIQFKSTTHQIITNGLPVHTKARLLTNEKLMEAKKIFEDLRERDILRASDSNWSSPLLMKLKKDKTWRCCGDYRRLNAITTKDEYPVPIIKDITTRLAKAKHFTKLDLEKTYYQIPMADEDIKKTAILTPFGLYEFLKMPFGLKMRQQPSRGIWTTFYQNWTTQ